MGVQESPSVIPTAVQAVTSPSPCCAGGALAHIRMHTQFSEDLLDHLRLLGHLNQENSCSPRGVFPSVVAAGRSLAAGPASGEPRTAWDLGRDRRGERGSPHREVPLASTATQNIGPRLPPRVTATVPVWADLTVTGFATVKLS